MKETIVDIYFKFGILREFGALAFKKSLQGQVRKIVITAIKYNTVHLYEQYFINTLLIDVTSSLSQALRSYGRRQGNVKGK